jgi:hypothetical protein
MTQEHVDAMFRAAHNADILGVERIERLPEVYGSPHQLVTTTTGYALADRETGEVVPLEQAPTDWLAAWLDAWQAQARVAMIAKAAVERAACERCDRAGTRTLHADGWTIIRSSPKPPKWDAPGVRGLLEMAADQDIIDEAALDNAVPLRPVPQHRSLMNLLSTLPPEWAESLSAMMEPEHDEPRIRKVERHG